MIQTHTHFLLVALIGIVIAAGCAGPAGEQPTGAGTEPPAEVLTLEAIPPSEGDYPHLDPCTIFTADDAAQVLGGPVENDPNDINLQFGACPYKGVDGATSVSVGAGYGIEAKQILLLVFGLRAEFSTNQAFKDWFEDVTTRSGAMSVVELVNVLYSDAPPAEGETIEAVSGFGDAAYYSWNTGDQSGGLIVAEGETIVTIAIKGLEESAARPLLQPLAQEILDRLPDDGFRTLPPKED